MKYLWGLGYQANRLLENTITLDEFDDFLDKNGGELDFGDKKISVRKPETINFTVMDVILIVASDDEVKRSIYFEALQYGISDFQIFFLYNEKNYPMSYFDTERIHDQDDNEMLTLFPELGKEYKIAKTNRKRKLQRSIVTSRCAFDYQDKNSIYERSPSFRKPEYQTDYVRYRTLELCINEIKRKNIAGSTAEAGVFYGTFSRYIHALLPDRKHLMFDTFESFDTDEFNKEVESGNCSPDFIETFKNPRIEEEMKKFEHPENCIIRKGYFPDTVTKEDMEARFCFVSLDMDFEESMLNGLAFFYPRLEKGGYIFMHDYNNEGLYGVKKAVERFFANNDATVVPICDEGGTLVVCK